MSQVNRTCNLKRFLRVADISKTVNKSLQESNLMRQRHKEIVKCKLLGTGKLRTFFNDNSQPIL